LYDIIPILTAFTEKVNKEKGKPPKAFLQLFTSGANSLDKQSF
jgi:hypothetical protein